MDSVAVPQHCIRQALKELGLLLLGGKFLLGLSPAHKFRRRHIGHRQDLFLQSPGLLLGIGLVDVGQKLVLLLKIPQHIIQVDGHQREGPHDQQTADDHADRREGHQSMGKDALKALYKKVTNIKSSHCRNTRPFRR